MNSSLKTLEQLADLIEHDETIVHYKQMAIKVHQNETVKQMYEAYIAKQKEVVKLTHFQKKEALKVASDELKQLEDALLDHPLLNNYLSYQQEINDLVQDMSQSIQFIVNEHLSKS